MGLEKFGSSKSEQEKLEEKCEIVSKGGVDWTPCKCDISEVYRFEEPVNEIDLIAHLREEHMFSFEDAKREVKNYKNISSSLRDNWEEVKSGEVEL